MADIPRRKIAKSLKAKGFVQTKSGSDHEWFVFCYNDKEYKHIMAKISRGSSYKTYPESLWKRMKIMLRLQKNQEVHDLLTCPMKHEQYLEILRKEGEIS
ncbi:MAG: hypothetical protein DRP45_04420 [Candidatus Zixiibacteriota bacterium]|nr:MAG: hypothetical protein DRP45_04420 [candidate division Zixibacteria bacterium]